MKTAGTGHAIQFRGEPSVVEGLLQIRHDISVDRAQLEARIDADKPIVLRRPLIMSTAAGDNITKFVLNLPLTTPPGSYHGVLQIGERTHPIEVIVDAWPRLVLMPGRLTLTAPPGHDEVVELTVTNSGNTVFEFHHEGIVNLLDSEALSVAVNSAISSKEKGQERINRFVDSMARGAGTAQVEVRPGAGAIEPGATRRLTITLHLPKSLQPGHSYRGAWELPNARLWVQVYVPAATPPEVKAS